MQHQAIDSLAAWPAEGRVRSGTYLASGYALGIAVWRGRLRVSDGVGRDRRDVLLHRASSGLRRLIVIGHTGSISLDAIRWLVDIKASYLQLDEDARLLAAFGPNGSDRPALRRSQAQALGTSAGLAISKTLIARKVAGQRAVVAELPEGAAADAALVMLGVLAREIPHAADTDELRAIEARAASAYWSAWDPVGVRFAGRDLSSAPAHWRTFGSRTSALTGGPRLAMNPANAILNYLYALLEAEATLAARIVGLDPGLGIMHADQPNRDSLAADLMEPVRPIVDRELLRLLGTRAFALRDFYETRAGVCRVTPPLAEVLGEISASWRRAVGAVAEDVATALDREDRVGRALPTPLTGRNRSASRHTRRVAMKQRRLATPRTCSWCGGPVKSGRATCGAECEAEARANQNRSAFFGSGVRRLREIRVTGADPIKAPAVRAKVASTQSARQADENAWNAEHPERPDPEVFRAEILPLLAGVSVGELSRRTGLSLGYCDRVKKGKQVPHPRWWAVLCGGSNIRS